MFFRRVAVQNNSNAVKLLDARAQRPSMEHLLELLGRL